MSLNQIVEVEGIKKELWGSLDKMRANMSWSKEKLFPLFIFWLRCENQLDEEICNSGLEIKNKLISISTQARYKYYEYSEVVDVFINEIEKTDDGLIGYLVLLFCSFDLQTLQKNQTELFEYYLYCFKRGFSFSEIAQHAVQPELVDLIWRIGNINTAKSVFNPFSGIGDFTDKIDQTQTLVGVDFNRSVWAISQLRSLAVGKSSNCQFAVGLSVNEWLETDKKYDAVVSFPPLGLKIPDVNGDKSSFNADYYVLREGIRLLTTHGRMVLVVSQGLLFNQSNKYVALRRQLIEDGALDCVVSFPSGLLISTGAAFAILVISKSDNRKSGVKIVDAKKFVQTKSNRNGFNVDAKLFDAILADELSESKRLVPNSEIIENNFDLHVPRYLHNNLSAVYEPVVEYDNESKANLGYKLVQMGEVGEFIYGNRVSNGKGKIVKIADLKNEPLNHTITGDSIEVGETKNPCQLIEQSCVLFATVGRNIKPTYFKYEGVPVLISHNIIAFAPNESIVDAEYLMFELYTPRFMEEVSFFYVGSTAPVIRRSDFQMLTIQLPSFHQQKKYAESINEQKLIVQREKEIYFKAKENELRLQKELAGVKDMAFREFASIRHTMRQYLAALKSNVSGTRKFIMQNEGKPVSLNTIYSKSLSQSFGEHLIGLEQTIESMARLLVTQEKNNLGTSEKLNVIDLITDVQGRLKNEDVFTFLQVIEDKLSFTDSEDNYVAPVVKIVKDDFFTVYSNIVSNAVAHGFKDSNKQNMIASKVSFNSESNMCEIVVSNNGKPMATGFSFSHLVTRGEKTTDSSGLGIGGADIKEIVESYNGTFVIRNNQDDEFPVQYIISLPLVNNTDDEN